MNVCIVMGKIIEEVDFKFTASIILKSAGI